MPSSSAIYLRDYLRHVVEQDGTFAAVGPGVVTFDTPQRVRVQVQFGLGDQAARLRDVAPKTHAGRLIVIVDQSRTPAVASLGELVGYEYDLFDQEYGYELGYHWDDREPPGYLFHRHEAIDGPRRKFKDSRVELDATLTLFRTRMWTARFPRSK